MKKITISTFVLGFLILSCNNDKKENSAAGSLEDNKTTSVSGSRHFRGALTGGYKGDSIFFDISADGTKLENLMFKGHWRCDGKIETLPAAGPEGSFTIVDNKVNDHISEPPDGGATAWRFDLSADIKANTASGTFRMNINALDCNTGTLSWEATSN